MADPPPSWGRARVVGLLLPVATVVAVGATMLSSGAGLDDRYLGVSWQLVDLPVLRDDPLGSVWYLHVQPPLFNLVVGTVLRWSPAPAIGTLFVGYLACLATTGVLLADLLRRWRVPALAAGVAASAGLLVPAPLGTIVGGSYEVPLATLLALALWLAQRHATRPRGRLLVALSVVLTAVVMTRSLFHPVWLAAVLALLAVARPVSRRAVVAAVAIPLVVVGGWTLKNDVVVGEPTMSSWFGFNLQRGVTSPMDRDAVDAAIDEGAVSALARRPPFQSLDDYPEADGCVPDDRHPALSEPAKRGVAVEVGNFNNPCYLPLYRQAQDDALALLRRDPGRYLATRRAAYVLAFRTAPLGVEDPTPTLAGPDAAERSWLDEVTSVLLVPVGVELDVSTWTTPLLGTDRLAFDVSLTLVAGFLVVAGRGALAAVRLVRAGWRDRADRWGAEDLTWVLAASMVGMAVVASALLELGENDRFRATVDPLLIALPLGLAARAAAEALGRRRARAADPTGVDGEAEVAETAHPAGTA